MHTFAIETHRPFSVLVVGAGGSGSAIFLALPYLHQAMQAWGHPGLDVVLMDDDEVSTVNCIRQPFALSDVGQKKSTVLVNRCNMFWGTSWSASTDRFSAKMDVSADIVIGCVDTRASRQAIHACVTHKSSSVRYWLDLGNNASNGQFVLGQPLNYGNKKADHRLRTAAELYPEIIDSSQGEDDLPSCSAVEALQRQEPFINHTLAMQALAMLTQLLRYGQIEYHGGFYNAKTGTAQPIPVPPAPQTKKRKKAQ